MTPDAECFERLAGFRHALRRFLAAAEAISKSAGVTQPQYQAMLTIKTWPSAAMTMKDLADQLLLTHHAAVQLVNRLARAGLVERTPSNTDGRSVILRLTPAGEALVERLAGRHLEELISHGGAIAETLQAVRRGSVAAR